MSPKIKALLFGVCGAIALGEGIVRLFPTWHDTFLQDIVHSPLPTDLYKPVGGFQPESVQISRDSSTIQIGRRSSRDESLTTGCTRMRMAFEYLHRVGKIDKSIRGFYCLGLVSICRSSSLETEFCRSVGDPCPQCGLVECGCGWVQHLRCTDALERVEGASG